jgi:uncharacterized protein (TIGR04255 family)
MFETFGSGPQLAPQLNFAGLFGPAAIRYWFGNDDSGYLLQIQRDRIIFNWRDLGKAVEYPRYPSIREQFVTWTDRFCSFLSENSLGGVVPNQCEVTYINTIGLPDASNPHGFLGRVTPFWPVSSEGSDDEIEAASTHIRKILKVNGEKVGRIYSNFTAAFTPPDMKPVIQLEVTARGKPSESTVDSAFNFLDIEHAAVVRNFATITSAEMHEFWEREDGGE